MPVQIDEIIITTTVAAQGASGSSVTAAPGADLQEHDRELADKILQIIREKSER
jgi:hypothetical protein